MKVKRMTFTEINQAVLVEGELDDKLKPTEILSRTLYSGISAGTEGAIYAGYAEPKPPTTSGSSNVGEVIAVGSEVKSIKIGDKVISWCNHDDYAKFDENPREYGWNGFRLGIKVPDYLPLHHAAVLYHYNISMSAIRHSQVKPGDDVLIIGAGFIGAAAAQLYAAAGALVTVADISEKRLGIMQKCGIPTVNPIGLSYQDIVEEITQGRKLHQCVMAVEGGNLISELVECMRVYGCITLLGGYRKETMINIAPLFDRINGNSLRIQGAGGMGFPVAEKPFLHDTHNGNYRQIAELMHRGKLAPEPLISLVSPADCQQVLQDLVYDKEKYLGCVFDWNKIR